MSATRERRGELLSRRTGRRGFGTWLRYNWPMVFVHLLLVTFGVLNLYPFLWMLGTSVKAEAEASVDRLNPVPNRKFRLVEGLDPRTVLPTALEPGLETAEGDAVGDHLAALWNKLTLLHQMQRAAWRRNVAHHAELVLRARDPALEVLKEAGDAAGAAARRVELEARVPGVLERLIEAGVLASDPARESLWPGPALTEGRAGEGLDAEARAVADALLDHLTVSPREYTKIAKGTAAAALADLQSLAAAGGALVPVARGAEPAAWAFALGPGARGRIYKDLYPRQILTLWAMQKENVRRGESRSTYATDRRSADMYAKSYGLVDLDTAWAELVDLKDAGYLEPGTVQWVNYWVVLREENFLLHFMTSVLITVVVVWGSILVASMLGYALASMRFPGKLLVLGVIIAASVLPTEARMIPIFKMLLSVGLLKTLWGMTIWMTSFGTGHTLLMAGFFMTLPKEVDEAAEVDGAGTFRKFFDIALPMARPVVMTVGLFAFLGAWNNFLVPLLCTISRPSMQPLAVAVYNFQQGHPGKWHQINAAAAIMILPVILLFLFVQKYVVKAIAVGAVKG